MKFLLKLFRALNSAQSPWQVTVAIVLGMIAGLTPISGIQNIVILLLAFVLNIHLGLFFVSAAFFAGVGYLFDPWFEQLGYAILTSEGVQGLWTSWYDNGVLRLTHFNNTLVMGATVVSLALALPLYGLLGWLIHRYRDVLGTFLAKRPIFGTFGFLKAVEQKNAVVRWWGAALFLVLVGIVGAIVLLVVDPLLKWGIEKGASAALQRDVRVGKVVTDFGNSAVEIRRIEIAGKEEGIDAVSADLIRFDAKLGPLLLDRVHIDEVAVSGVGFGTPATLKKAPAPETETAEKKKGSMFKMPAFTFPDPKTLIEKADLQSVKVYEEAKAKMEAIQKRWSGVAKTELTAEKLDGYKADLERLRQLSKSKEPQQLLALAAEIKSFKEKIDKEKKRLDGLKADFGTDRKKIAALTEKVKKAPMEDYNRLKSTYTLDSSGVMNVIGTLFGDRIKGYLATFRKYYAMVSPHLKRDPTPPAEAVPPRGEGRWIRYAQTVPVPDLLVALTKIDGTFKAQGFTAEIRDISDNQKALGRPLTFSTESDGPQVKGLRLRGEDNRLGAGVKDTLAYEAERIPTGALPMQSVMIEKADMALKGDLALTDASALSGKGHIAFSGAAVRLEAGEGKAAQIAADVLEGISAFRVDTELSGTLDAPKVSASSDLDRQISGGIGRAMGKGLDAYKGELRTMLDAKTGTRLQSLDGIAQGIPDIGALVGGQDIALSDLASQAAGLLGSGLKGGKLPF